MEMQEGTRRTSLACFVVAMQDLTAWSCVTPCSCNLPPAFVSTYYASPVASGLLDLTMVWISW